MLFVENNNRDPYQNHGLEEWLMDSVEEDCFMLWCNEKAILLGKHQNAFSEINMPYAKQQGIKIVRRITGGGTVFTDEGNIMFSFISCNGKRNFADFHSFTEPILKALRKMGIPAEFSGRNDLIIEGRKFSGNAQCKYKDKVLHHGTIMYSANTEELAKALNVRAIKLKSKGVASVKSRVTNISSYLSAPMEIESFRQQLFQMVMAETEGARAFHLNNQQWKEVARIAGDKYARSEWIYGFRPDFEIHKETKFASGIIEVFVKLAGDRIEAVHIFGDFFGDGEISEIEQKLKGILYTEPEIKHILDQFSLIEYFGQITSEELVNAFIDGKDGEDGR